MIIRVWSSMLINLCSGHRFGYDLGAGKTSQSRKVEEGLES